MSRQLFQRGHYDTRQMLWNSLSILRRVEDATARSTAVVVVPQVRRDDDEKLSRHVSRMRGAAVIKVDISGQRFGRLVAIERVGDVARPDQLGRSLRARQLSLGHAYRPGSEPTKRRPVCCRVSHAAHAPTRRAGERSRARVWRVARCRHKAHEAVAAGSPLTQEVAVRIPNPVSHRAHCE